MSSAPRYTEAQLRRMQSGQDPANERSIQSALITWADAQSGDLAPLNDLFAVPNGQYRPGQAPEPGIRSGVPDLFLPYPTPDWMGLFLELKREGGTLRDSQEEWCEVLLDRGYAVIVAYGFGQAQRVCTDYCSHDLDPNDLYAP